MRVMITGGTGFLGINLIQQCLSKGYEVFVIHRESSNTSVLAPYSVNLIQADMLNAAQLKHAVPHNLDAIFHVAGDTNMWAPNNHKQYQTNVTATQNLVDVAIANRAKRFIHTSSISAYGFHDTQIHESTPSTALSSGVNYLKTKFLGEQAVKQAVIANKLDAVILNPCAIIGPHDRSNWSQLFTMINEGTLPGIPSGEGSYCHVNEVAKAHITALTHGKSGENYILAGVDHAFVEVAGKIGNLLSKQTPNKTVPDILLKSVAHIQYWRSLITGKEPTMTPEKASMITRRVVASSDKAERELGYNSKITIDEMLNDCYQWLKAENLV